uniref:Trichohyalin-like n=1 Tax=Cicer arietinum TaxID=3827 RepID=A0A1S2Z223_CICAR|nr:trichohyalin-like [Cicer arietinum]
MWREEDIKDYDGDERRYARKDTEKRYRDYGKEERMYERRDREEVRKERDFEREDKKVKEKSERKLESVIEKKEKKVEEEQELIDKEQEIDYNYLSNFVDSYVHEFEEVSPKKDCQQYIEFESKDNDEQTIESTFKQDSKINGTLKVLEGVGSTVLQNDVCKLTLRENERKE